MKGLRKHERRVKELTYQVRAVLSRVHRYRAREERKTPVTASVALADVRVNSMHASRIKTELLITGIHRARVVREAFTKQHRRGARRSVVDYTYFTQV